MTQNPTPQTLRPEDQDALKQGEVQDDLRALQEGTPDAHKAVQERMKPHFPEWPTSKRGPMTTPNPPGTRPINALTGQTSFDQPETAQEVLRKRKERL